VAASAVFYLEAKQGILRLFRAISDLVPLDADYPERTRVLTIYQRILDGTIYDVLPYEFHEERSLSGEYVPLRQRRPSVRYGLARLVVEDSVALLFSEGHFPSFESSDATVRDALAAFVRDARLNAVMVEAGLRGSVGSVALLLRVLRGRVFVDVLDALYLTPEWDRQAPDTLMRITERYKASGASLAAQGFPIADPSEIYWFQRVWDDEFERWYQPMPVGSAGEAEEDSGRSIRHGLGFVPLVWIRNLPGGQGVDGACTFRSAIDTGIEIDYQLSQAGRGLKYSSDPTLLIREPAGLDGTMVRGAANALVVSEKGDAKLLEIGGTASQAVIEYVRVLRDLALESLHGNRADAQRLAAPASGRAMELMQQGLLWLADNLRVSYGQGALLSVARMVLRASHVFPLRIEGRSVPALNANAQVSLRWPDWYPDDALDGQRKAETLISLVGAAQMSRETALRILASDYDIEDVAIELQRIRAEHAG
jgi:hypothetical protein